jgi:16S rRNA (uracil1498-N3)-methyltransferase
MRMTNTKHTYILMGYILSYRLQWILSLHHPRFASPCSRLYSSSTPHVNPRSPVHKLPRLYVGSIPSRNNPHVWTQSLLSLTPSLWQGKIVVLSSDQSHYVSTVLRLKNQALLRLFDGTEEWLAELVFTDTGSRKRQRSMEIMATCREKLRSLHTDNNDKMEPLKPWLCIAPLKKKDRQRWLVEKSTELDVGGFLWLDTQFSQSTMMNDDKLITYAIEAAEQCERIDIPHVLSLSTSTTPNESGVYPLAQFWNEWATHKVAKLFICRERSNAQTMPKALQNMSGRRQVAFLLGPEGGWSQEEEELMDKMEDAYPDDICNISLGPCVLRTETAAMAALATYSILLHGDDQV